MELQKTQGALQLIVEYCSFWPPWNIETCVKPDKPGTRTFCHPISFFVGLFAEHIFRLLKYYYGILHIFKMRFNVLGRLFGVARIFIMFNNFIAINLLYNFKILKNYLATLFIFNKQSNDINSFQFYWCTVWLQNIKSNLASTITCSSLQSAHKYYKIVPANQWKGKLP